MDNFERRAVDTEARQLAREAKHSADMAHQAITMHAANSKQLHKNADKKLDLILDVMKDYKSSTDADVQTLRSRVSQILLGTTTFCVTATAAVVAYFWDKNHGA